LAITGSSTFTATQGTATGINGGHVVVGDGSTLVVGGTINNVNQILLSAAGHATKFLVLSPVTLKGGGLVSLSSDSHNLISAIGGNAVLTNVDNQIAGAGAIQVPLINQSGGIVNAKVASVPLVIEVVSNGGVLEASNGAELLLESPLRGSGGVIKALSGSKVVIEDTMIDGGTLLTSGTGVISATGVLVQVTGSSGHAVVNSGTLHVDAIAGLQTQGAFTNSGTISVDTSLRTQGIFNNGGTVILEDGTATLFAGTVNNGGSIVISGSTGSFLEFADSPLSSSVTLSGHGQIALSDAAGNDFEGSDPTATTTLNNVDNTISGAAVIGAGGHLALNNGKLGIIDASGAINALILAAPVTNSGTLKATGSAGLTIGSIVKNTSAATIEADTGSRVDLDGATIIGGKLQTIGTGRIHVSSASFAALDGGASQVVTNTMISNLGVLTVEDHGVLDLQGTINNTGEIALQAADDVLPGHAPETELEMLPSGAAMASVTLQGHGLIGLNNNSHNVITGGSFSLLHPFLVTLINVDNTITGAGTIGGNGLVLNNKAGGEIDATASTPLIIDTGTNTVTNAGILGSTVSSTLFIASALNNTGQLNTNGGTIDVEGPVSGTGFATISGSGQVEFAAASTNGVKFLPGSIGVLVLDNSAGYHGTISGFDATNSSVIDLADIEQATVSATFSNGHLLIHDAHGHSASIAIAGSHTIFSFQFVPDANGGTLVSDPPIDHAAHTIADGGTLEIEAAATGKVTFAGPTGTLRLDESWGFTGKVADFRGQDLMDLADLTFGAQTTLAYAGNSTGGTLKVGDGIHAARIALLGTYMASSFTAASDGHGGTLISTTAEAAGTGTNALSMAVPPVLPH
jgi:hypothetical protein